MLAVLVALPLLACAFLWFRQSPFVSVQRVQISGVRGADAPAVQAALTQAAHGMSTLDVSDGALRAAVSSLRVVREVRAVPSFPHTLRIEVVEQLPVAGLTIAGVHTAVAADGVVLGPALADGSLPSVSDSASGDDAIVPAPGRLVTGAGLLAELTVLGAAPAPLARHIERVFSAAKGITVAMRNGLLVYFGDASRPHAKWLSLARVLADPSSAGASYVDVRLPSHPAAGFPAGVSPPDASAIAAAPSTAGTGGTESTIASLAASLSDGTATSDGDTTSPTGTVEPGASSTAASAPGETATEPEAGAGATAGTSEASQGSQAPVEVPTNP